MKTWQEEWIGTQEWELAKIFHDILCRRLHSSDTCWGLEDPYLLRQKEMPFELRNWLSRALAYADQIGDINTALESINVNKQNPFSPFWGVPQEINRANYNY